MAREYTENELRDVLAQYLESDGHRLTIRDLAAAWSHEDHGPRRYAKLYEDDNLTLWVLGWRPGVDTIDHHVDITPIHGHGKSAALVTCLEGEVDNDDYGKIPQVLEVGDVSACRFEPQVLGSGHSLYVPRDGVHVMRCDEADHRGFALTLHLYSPRLLSMTYYDVAATLPNGTPTNLKLVDTWTDTDADVLAPRELRELATIGSPLHEG